mmetsp:Transcript_58687/g.139740  ORF Transcript_58687/g.139740 Transcript_58687/m.139740 type:complete len:218 (-) Transcript_58687:820-1473(-)
MYWYFRWCSRISNGSCCSETCLKPRCSMSRNSRSLESTTWSPSTYPPSHLDFGVKSSSQEKGVTITTAPPGRMSAWRPSRQASGSGSRHSRLASTAPSKLPNSSAWSLSLHASPVRNTTRCRAAASTLASCCATTSASNSPSSGTLKRTTSPRFIFSAASMKAALKSMPMTSSKPPAASSKEEPPTAQPMSSARIGAPDLFVASSNKRATRWGKRSA